MSSEATHDLAMRILTEKEFQVWKLHDTGMSTRRISLALNLSRWTIRDTLANAERKLNAATTNA